MIHAIAIDDEPMALEVVKAHAQKVSFLNLSQTFVSAVEALAYLKTNPVDLVFLDINMPDITGVDFSQLLPPNTAFIFTTAYSQYAVDAFKINALDYLLKPIDFNRFVQACQKAHQAIKKEEAPADYLFVKDGYDWTKVSIADVAYVESDGNYLTFKEKKQKNAHPHDHNRSARAVAQKTFFARSQVVFGQSQPHSKNRKAPTQRFDQRLGAHRSQLQRRPHGRASAALESKIKPTHLKNFGAFGKRKTDFCCSKISFNFSIIGLCAYFFYFFCPFGPFPKHLTRLNLQPKK